MEPRDRTDELYRAALESLRSHSAAGLGEPDSLAVWRRLVVQLDAFQTSPAASLRRAGARRWGWLALAGAAATAGIMGLWFAVTRQTLPDTPPLTPALPRVVMAAGQVRLDGRPLDETGAGRLAVFGAWLPPGAQLELGEGARLALQTAGERLLAIGPSRIVVHNPAPSPPTSGERPRPAVDAGPELTLLAGQLLLSVAPRPTRSLVVRAGQDELIVLGTTFGAAVDGGSLAALAVESGLVGVRPIGQQTLRRLVGPGAVPAGVDPGARHAVWPDAARGPGAALVLTLADLPFDAPWWRDAESDAPDDGWCRFTSEPAGAMLRLGRTVIGPTPVLTRWPVGRYELELALDGYATWRQAVTIDAAAPLGLRAALEPRAAPSGVGASEVLPRATPRLTATSTALRAEPGPWEQARQLLAAGRCAELDRLVTELIANSTSSAERARAEMFRAECALRAGDRPRAMAFFNRVAREYPDTPSAEGALFGLAKLQMDMGLPEAGLAGLERYLQRYPRGVFVRDAATRRCELLALLGRQAAARQCLADLTQK